MKRSFLLIAAVTTMAFPVMAGVFDTPDSYGPRSPSGITTEIYPTTDEQVKANIEAGRAGYKAIGEAGGCNADILPVTIAAYCWDNDKTNPTGGPLGASMGGSD